jgi:hypothetical protein
MARVHPTTSNAAPAANAAPAKESSTNGENGGTDSAQVKAFCPYCQRFKTGRFRLTGNQRHTRICESCFELRKQARVPRRRIA